MEKYVPYKKLSRQEVLQKDKPWMTKGLITSIKKKNIIKRKALRTKDPTKKQELEDKYKTYKNKLTKLTRQSKQTTLITFFMKINLIC